MKKEFFDIYNDDHEWIGTASREEVHAKGYLHHTFHCWIVRDTPDGRKVLFQKRQTSKDTFPGYYDITAAGHLAAGETVADAVRELEEELGVTVSLDQLIPLGTADYENQGIAGGRAFIDRERCFIFGAKLDLPLAAYRLQAEELTGLYEADLNDALKLAKGELEEMQATGILSDPRPASDSETFGCTVSLQHFVPHNSDYYHTVFTKLLGL
ncbi:NUDIX domain-containing protein [Paenibacillus sp. XY044]|uniref:NUDIX hydrolase n=1 Tax=Paenibacillus sp. XY044 TaxID=2026089 RepID=UPI000B987B43|nr:NUDIX domain-containing protein [Paenibacillus sp. XY044]OZB90728.1 NUDIX hydrolase [Paenibacillus sp. XY044]